MRPTFWRMTTLLALGLLAASPALAQGIDHRLHRQAYQIENGIASGALTRREAHSLLREQRRIHRLESRLAGDGRISYHESRLLDQRLDQAGARIRILKGNPNRGYGYPGGRWHPGHGRFGGPRHHHHRGPSPFWP